MTMQLIKVAHDTIARCKRDKDTSHVFLLRNLLCDVRPKDSATEITVKNLDYITLAYEMSATYPRTAILNMCSDKHVGGGFLKGASAGEEELCRRSSLYQQLMHHAHEYPFSERKLIYSKNVTIFKSEGTYAHLKPERDVDVITIAAPRNPKLKSSGDAYQYADDFIDMRERIDAMLTIAKQNGIDCLVLSAFGSGCFNNPPKQVAKIFRDRISRFDFKHVAFGILDDRLRGRTTNNYQIYKDVLEKNM